MLIYRRIGPALDAGFFIFGSKCFRTFRQARDALGGTQGRGSLTTEEAGKNAKRFAPTFVGTNAKLFSPQVLLERANSGKKKANYPHGTSAKKQVAAATCRVSFMVKLLRAYGGCLGARRR